MSKNEKTSKKGSSIATSLLKDTKTSLAIRNVGTTALTKLPDKNIKKTEIKNQIKQLSILENKNKIKQLKLV